MDISSMYEGLVEEEDELVGKLKTCEGFMRAMLEFLSRNCGFAEEIGEKLLTELNAIEQELRTELLHLRLEKGLLAGRMRSGSGGNGRKNESDEEIETDCSDGHGARYAHGMRGRK